MKKLVPYIVIGILVIGFIGVIGYLKMNNSSTQIAGQNNATNNENEPYFDENAVVMYFYSPNCSHCLQEKPILTDLAKGGLLVKPMNILDHPDYAKQYNIEGTPEFLSQKDGQRLKGFQEKEPLKKWLEAHK